MIWKKEDNMFSILKNLQKVNLVKLLKIEKLTEPTIIAVGIAIFVVANLLISPVSLRLDLSQGQAYTLTPSTKKILQNLDDIVLIRFYVSSDIPTRLQPVKTDVTDLLKEYDKYGKVEVKILDPKKDTNAATQARNAGIPELQFSQMEQDKFAVTSSFFGISVSKGSQVELIPQATDIQSLEYNLTSLIYKLSKKELPQVGVLEQPPALGQAQDDISILRQVLAQQFTVNSITIATGEAETIDTKNKSLLVFDTPEKQFADIEIKAIRDYLKNKGTALFFTNGVKVDETLQTQPANAQIQALLNEYGIRVNDDLLLSTQAELVNFGSDVQSFLVLYPFWLKTNVFSKESGYFSNITQLTYPWVSSLTLNSKSGVQTKELVNTTKTSWQQRETFTLSPQNILEPKKEELKQFLITAESSKKNEGKIVVIPSSRFVQDRFLARNSGNLELVLNILNDYASGGALSGIRQRAVNIYPIPSIPESQKDIFKYGNILLLPALFALYGAIRLMRRK